MAGHKVKTSSFIAGDQKKKGLQHCEPNGKRIHIKSVIVTGNVYERVDTDRRDKKTSRYFVA